MSDRVELTGPEKREFERQYRHALRGRIELEGLTFPPTPQLLRAVESIVAARVQALTADRDDWERQAINLAGEFNDADAEATALRAELVTANTRCAELEAGLAASHAEIAGLHSAWAERDAKTAALQATLDRVTAATAGAVYADFGQHHPHDGDDEEVVLAVRESDLRAALRKPPGLDSRGRSILNPNYGIDDEGGASDEHR